MLRPADGSKQVFGLVAIDMRTGTIWGSPTCIPYPYPSNRMDTKPQAAQPDYGSRHILRK